MSEINDVENPVEVVEVVETVELPDKKKDNTVPIVAILSVAIIVLACIVACTITTYAFLINAPW